MLSIDRQHDLSSLPPSNIILLQLPGPNCGACYLELTKEGFLFLMEAGPLAKRMAKQRDVILGLHRVLPHPIAAGIYFVESLLPNLTQSLLSELWFCCITNQPKTWWLTYVLYFSRLTGISYVVALLSMWYQLRLPSSGDWTGLQSLNWHSCMSSAMVCGRRQENWVQLCRWPAGPFSPSCILSSPCGLPTWSLPVASVG